MICNCTHSKVCRLRLELIKAVEGILEIRFGGPSDGAESIFEMVRKYCKFRQPEL